MHKNSENCQICKIMGKDKKITVNKFLGQICQSVLNCDDKEIKQLYDFFKTNGEEITTITAKKVENLLNSSSGLKNKLIDFLSSVQKGDSDEFIYCLDGYDEKNLKLLKNETILTETYDDNAGDVKTLSGKSILHWST